MDFSDSVAAVFSHWKTVLGHDRARMDLKRAQAIRNALKLYSLEECCLAIDGCAASAFHMGENANLTKYDSITLILRDSDHIEKFVAFGEQAHRMIAARQKRVELAEAEQTKAPPTEEEKARVRELLKSCRLRRVA